MVNTRRHYSTNAKQSSVEESSVDRGSSDVDEPASSPEEETESWTPKWANNSTSVLTNRVRELRSRFVCSSERTYNRQGKTHLRPLQSKRLDMERRQDRRVIYSKRNILLDDDSEDILDDLDPDTSGFNIYSSPRRTRRRIIKTRKCLDQTEEINYSGENRRNTRQVNSDKISEPFSRSRSGLRPLKRESYADPNSPFSQDLGNSYDEKPDIEIRRSKRQRKFKYNTFNTSWITEHQMIRGYPKFKRDFISDHEDDSKDSRIPDDGKSEKHEILNDIPMRQKRTCSNNKKYVYKYLSRSATQADLNQKLHQECSQINGSGEPTQNSIDNSKNKSNCQNIERPIVNGEAIKDEEISHKEDEPQNDAEDDSNKISSNTTPLKRNSRLRQRSGISYNLQEMERNDSDSTTEERHSSPKYKLRQRKPKPSQLNQAEETRGRRKRRELPRRARRAIIRTKNSDSSDSSTTDTDDEIQRSKKHIAGITSMQKRQSNRRANTPPLHKNKQKKDLTLDPTTIDSSITFKSIGGLDEQYRCLREMVILPMLYPEIFQKYRTNPPKGVLFYGPPGTGKTLMARALANECSFGNRKVTFFMRKGADLLSKWVGQTEKQMTLLFEQAAQMAPSIIFFDEIDGLAPTRTARQEQVHVSVVASLLALMDGLDKTRNEVTVIGATNRLDALDPALRRPGRFDREIYFPLPALEQRKAILKIILSEWPDVPSDDLIDDLAERSVGYCGADLRALCTEAVLKSIRRTYPQIYDSSYRLLIDHNKIKVNPNDFHDAGLSLVPAGARGAPIHTAAYPPTYLMPLLSESIQTAINLVIHNYPSANKMLPSERLRVGRKCARLLVARNGSHLVASALLKEFEHLPVLTLDAITLHSRLGGTPEETCIQILNETRRNSPSILYLPKLNLWWDMANETVKTLVQMMYSTYLTNTSAEINSILLLATVDTPITELPNQISELFSEYRHEILEVDIPIENDRENFFRPLIVNESLEYKISLESSTPVVYEPLPRAPTPPPPPLSPKSRQVLFDKEEETLIELRIFLRDVCKKLASNKAFFMFTKPVDLEEVPDYLDVVEKPMDLETMMTKVDLHCYCSAQEFLMDIDLIQLNALTYNPDVTPADKQIRHRACWFRDYAYALIKAEMDTDFEDNCRKISKNRKVRQTGEPNEFLPHHIRALAEESSIDTSQDNKSKILLDQSGDQTDQINENNDGVNKPLSISIPENDKIDNSSNKNNTLKICSQRTSPHPQRKRRVPPWARGFLTGNKKRRKIYNNRSNVNPVVETVDQKMDLIDKIDSDAPLENSSEHKENQPNLTSPNQIRRDSTSNINPVKIEHHTVTINKQELNKILSRTVRLTEGCSIEILSDLYMQLENRIKKYSSMTNRQQLVQDLNEELDRFEKHYY